MQDTRQQILEILRRHSEVTVQELSRELGLTSVTVRHHLEILRSEGYITEPEIRRSSTPGRPRYVYRLTSTAADLFPNNYSGLAAALLVALEETAVSEEHKQQFLTETATQMVGAIGPLPALPAERMNRLVAFLNRHGFVARWEETPEQHYHVYISGCPYHYVAQKHCAPCEIDALIIRQVSGGEPRRLQGHAHAGALCVYEIHWDDGLN